LEFVRVQPYVSPKIELSDERQEQVDLRVLPVIFRFQKKDLPVYPGQEVDVYISQSNVTNKPSPQVVSNAQAVTVGPAPPSVPIVDSSTDEPNPPATEKSP